ncbi:MAG TPA: 3-deoxy-7-phosphoheptulonate synthase [Sphingomicrobium sp.]|nr:3-deoxy-7-phosphoheptulonate synthase [Sphingomicrobium sp.]
MNMTNALTRLRWDLDDIDNQLLDLIEKRLLLCATIGDSKRTEARLFLRPQRQQALVRRLQARAKFTSPEAVRHVWRELMAHSLQVQAPLTLLLVDDGRRDRLQRLAREQFGSAPGIEWARDARSALSRASGEHVVAIIPHQNDLQLASGLHAFELLRDEDGRPTAWAVGRVNEEATDKEAARSRGNPWRPNSWRKRPALQLPEYDDDQKLKDVEKRLAGRAPIVELNDVDILSCRLAEVANGRAILLQAGDCAESFEHVSRTNTVAVAELLAEMAARIEAGAACGVVRVGRIAGQFAKPRTKLMESIAGVEIHAYRGDAINDAVAAPLARQPDPDRLLRAQEHSERTARWLASHVPDGQQPIFSSHEALLLNYEEALTQYDELSGRWWSGSGHMLWIGERTRQIDGAHIEYVRGIANPIAIKYGPSADPDKLCRLLEALNPERPRGRVTLIPRLGYKHVEARLPLLMRAAAREGWIVPWCLDPMHGNTQVTGGRKTRDLDHIRAEIGAFFAIALAEGAWPGGIHLEVTPDDVTECIGGKSGITETDLSRAYKSACDPRLNRSQALEIADFVSEQYAKFRQTGRNA